MSDTPTDSDIHRWLEGKHRCAICGQEFFHRLALEAHLGQIHDKEE